MSDQVEANIVILDPVQLLVTRLEVPAANVDEIREPRGIGGDVLPPVVIENEQRIEMLALRQHFAFRHIAGFAQQLDQLLIIVEVKAEPEKFDHRPVKQPRRRHRTADGIARVAARAHRQRQRLEAVAGKHIPE
ncbi:hypothetical protein SDC9_94353 [bioreactor metagenome]|uniref:Uncharacterized protein n=1 Tax=bioreactor metagenome TaxID=1076179 RepID=A0A645A3M2_9ZZZZ